MQFIPKLDEICSGDNGGVNQSVVMVEKNFLLRRISYCLKICGTYNKIHSKVLIMKNERKYYVPFNFNRNICIFFCLSISLLVFY